MATNGTINNKPAIVRRVTSASDKNTVSFTSVTQGQLDTPDLSALKTTDSVISKIDVTLGGIAGRVPVGGKKDFKYIQTINDYPTTGDGGIKMLDIYGRVLVIDGTDIVVDKTASGQPKFETTSVVYSDDVSPGNKSYDNNKGLVYYTKMTAGTAPATLTVGDALGS